MESKENQKTWPVIGQSDVADFCREICDSILVLERAFETGGLSNKLASDRFEQILGPRLYGTYGKLAKGAAGPLQHLRVDAVRALLAQLQNDLAPTQIAHAKGRMPLEGEPCETETGKESPPRFPFEFVDAGFDDASSTIVRFDQMLDARFWRIGFTFETPDLCDTFAQLVVRSTSSRLASDLLGLQRILERFNPKTGTEDLKIVPYPRDRRFEHLILDILNEHEHQARAAPLIEDFLEKTDLRVKYPGLNRPRGARVQLTSIVAPELHKTKLEEIKLADEFVFLSPLSLAEFVGSLEHTPPGLIPGTPSFASARLWECLEGKPTGVPQLASELKRIMFRALMGTPDSPLGAMVKVPLSIRQLIRQFVETHAIASTSKLRERERGDSSDLASSENVIDECSLST
jgi:hypothetical protein